MLFNSLQYLIFLPLVVVAYWILPKKARPIFLLIASYYFYMSWMRVYGWLLFGLTLGNYLIGLWLGSAEGQAKRRLILIGGLTANLACLSFFKYTNFLRDTFWNIDKFGAKFFPAFFHPSAGFTDLPIILPLGISFFVF